jgi:hypothetical protein
MSEAEDGFLFEGRVDGLPMPVFVHENGTVGGGGFNGAGTYHLTLVHVARQLHDLQRSAREAVDYATKSGFPCRGCGARYSEHLRGCTIAALAALLPSPAEPTKETP